MKKTFTVLEERKSTTGSRWDGGTVVEHHRLREVFDERFSTEADAQACAVAMLEDPNRAKTKGRVLVIAELRSKVISEVNVSTVVRLYG
jgi:hypothetical protein